MAGIAPAMRIAIGKEPLAHSAKILTGTRVVTAELARQINSRTITGTAMTAGIGAITAQETAVDPAIVAPVIRGITLTRATTITEVAVRDSSSSNVDSLRKEERARAGT